MLDRDLADLYAVSTKVLNQAVKRNRARFPSDFMFTLTKKEKEELVTICDRFEAWKHSTVNPSAFTEQGVAMLSSVLRSERAVQVNIIIMRTFVKLRNILNANKALEGKFNQLENRMDQKDKEIKVIFEAIRRLMNPPERPIRKIGFHLKES